MSEPSPLHAAKLAVMAAVPYLQKQRAAGLNYTFAGEAELIAKLHPAMIAHGLTVAPAGVQLLADGQYTTAKGAVMHRVLVTVTYRLTHAATGTHEDLQVIAEAADSSDKAAGKAMTGALKVALRQAFLIETGDEPDEVRPEGPGRKQQAKAPAKPATNGPAARMPADGAELEQRLRAHDALLARSGLCEPGSLVKAVLRAVAGTHGNEMVRWPAAAIATAVTAAKGYEAERRAVAGGTQ